MKRKNKLVNPTRWTQMDGATSLEKYLNAYLTRRFITGSEVPADECLSEAREVIEIVILMLNTSIGKKAIKKTK